MTMYLLHAFIYLLAAVITVPIAKRLGLGSVLGYMIAGVIIGPIGGFVGSETENIQHVAEFGIVMLLFMAGLELEPRMLWKMRNKLVGLGGLQILITSAIVMSVAMFFGQTWQSGLAIGMMFSLSATAIALQTLNEKGWVKTDGGQSSFSVLLFQDIAVIPMFTIIPLLAVSDLMPEVANAVKESAEKNLNFYDGIPEWQYALMVISAITAIVIGGHYLSRPLFNYIAKTRLKEIFTITALMLIVGIALLMNLIGLSAALGTFLAGVVLATSEFRHALESNIEPFKGILLGLFFITIGAGTDFSLLADNFVLIASLTVGVMALKFLVLMGLAYLFKIKNTNAWLFSLSISQVGVFAFILLGFSAEHHVITESVAKILTLVVTSTMFLTPILFLIYEYIVNPYFQKKYNAPQENDAIEEKGDVIIAGGGRFGEVINRLLVQNGIKTTVIDFDANIVDSLRMFKMKSYFGDASDLGLLKTAGIDEAKLLVIAIDEKEARLALVNEIKREYPNLPIISRCYDTSDFYELKQAGVQIKTLETLYSALELGSNALEILGTSPEVAKRLKQAYLDANKECHEELCNAWVGYSEGRRKEELENYIERFLQMENKMAEMMSKRKAD